MQRLEDRFGSLFVKCALVGALTLLILWPLSRVESLVNERQERRHEAAEAIARGFGGAQVIGGPVLSLATEERSVVVDPATHAGREVWRAAAPLRVLPEALRITSTLHVELRSKGIYEFPVYVTRLTLTGSFAPGTLARLLAPRADLHLLPDRATVLVPLCGMRSLRALTAFEFAGRRLEPSSGALGGVPGLSAAVDLATLDPAAPLPFRIEMEVAGSESLHFLPLAANTVVSADLGWPDPDFDGAFLPVERSGSARRYAARWQVLELNRNLPRSWRGEELSHDALLATAFGLRLMQPTDLYVQNYRAVRYGILFVAITFACFFAFEHGACGVSLHPMHYLLVGLALATFYLLLLALSEQVGFGIAYGAAAGALVALICAYLSGVTRSPRSATAIGVLLALAYGALYLVLLSEDYALLLGALLVFGVLAALMLATRSLDWRQVRPSER